MDLSQLSSADLDQLRGLLRESEAKDTSARSPIRPRLTNLRDPGTPKGRLNRPSFFFNDEGETFTIPAYPCLMFRLFNDRVEERKVLTPTEKIGLLEDGWLEAPPMVVVKATVDTLSSELAALSEEDRAFVLDANKQARLKALQVKLSGLSDHDLAAVSGTVTAKRGPGRPRKADGDV